MDHPAIESAMRTGYPHGDPEYPKCPVCGKECEKIYKHDAEIIGCDECIQVQDAWEVNECF